MNDVEFENQKQRFLDGADAKILLKAIELKKAGVSHLTIVTEETTSNNDSKPFKKIPTIAGYLGTRCLTMLELISDCKKEVV